MIAHSHYGDSIDLEALSHGYAPGFEVHELEEMETAVAPLSQDLVLLHRRGAWPNLQGVLSDFS